MRIRNILLGAFTLLLIACSDDLSNLGSSIRPDADDLLPKTALFEIKSSTFLADSIYLRTTYPLLGQIEDPFYKTAIQADYASTFYAPDGFNLNVYNSEADTFVFKLGEKGGLLNNQIDSAILRIFYEQYYGDSLAPMVVTAYELTESLPKNFYSNMSFDSYYDSQSPIGKAAYTAIDMSVSDSIKDDADYIPYIDIHLIPEIKERFFNAIINTPQVFDSKSAFQEFFKGVYFKNTFGNGTLVQVEHSTIGFFYTTVDTVMSSVGVDSLVYTNRTKSIFVAPDVIQLNSLRSVTPNTEILDNDTATFVISPGSYFTEVKLPIGSIMDTLEMNNDANSVYLNGFNLKMNTFAPGNFFGVGAPNYLLMVERSKINDFFENNRIPDNKTSYIASFDTTDSKYNFNFGNINAMILNMADSIKKANDGVIGVNDTIKMALVPVTLRMDETYGTSIIQVSNYFLPSGIAIKGGTNKQSASMIFTERVNQ